MSKYESEKSVVDYLLKRASEHRCVARKVRYENRKGAPDWWLFFPSGELFIVETKSTTGKLSALQEQEIALLREMGQNVFVIGSRADVDDFFETSITD